MEVIDFERHHVDWLKPRDYGGRLLSAVKSLEFIDRSIAWTMVHEGEVVACVGIIHYWSGVAEAWTISSERVVRLKFSFHRTIMELIERVFQQFRLNRLQASVHADHEVSMRWLERLGFKNEGLMKKYLPTGEDAYRYSLVR